MVNINPRTTVLFLPCPYFELNAYNTARGYIAAETDKKELERIISRYNTKVFNINSVVTPSICEDFIKYGKGKGKPLKKKVDYRQLVDGCHPSPMLTKLWLMRFVKLVDRL